MIRKKMSEEKSIHETKLKILDTAEKLFAMYGFEATSIRNIVNDAGLSVALVNYHFGSKEELIVAVLNRIILPLEKERLIRLEALKKQHGTELPHLEEIMDAFICPFFKLFKNQYYLALIGRTFFEMPISDPSVFSTESLQTQHQFEEILTKVIPDIQKEDLNFKMSCILGMIRHFLSISGTNEASFSKKIIKTRLIQYAVAILSTP